jgi:hypothetical protein
MLNKDRLSIALFTASLAVLFFVYGGVVGKYHIFPFEFLRLAKKGCAKVIFGETDGEYFFPARYPNRPAIYNSGQACEGLRLITCITPDRKSSVKVMDLDGKIVHEWIIDWFKIWPDAKHVPDSFLPKSRPGTDVHGTVVTKNGDLVFNFEYQGLVRLDAQGNVVWRLPYQTHHSVVEDDNGNFWVCGRKEHTAPDALFPGFKPPFGEDTILEVSPEGRIIQEWSVPALLRKNGLERFLYFYPRYDALHLNDVEPFPATLEEGFFKKGDILVSLCSVSAVFVFNQVSEEIKFIVTVKFIKQHDPDFIDGNSFSVFDNNYIKAAVQQSRILIISAPESKVRVFFEGNPNAPFYTFERGKNEWLPNNDLLIAETAQGRAFEINQNGEIVWEYINYVGKGRVGMVTDAQRLPSGYTQLFRRLKK